MLPYREQVIVDLKSCIDRIPATFPNYAAFDVALPAGHWREMAMLVDENAKLREALARALPYVEVNTKDQRLKSHDKVMQTLALASELLGGVAS